MKKFLSLTAGLLSVMAVQAADTLFIKAPQVPILIERNDNVLFYMRMDAKETKTLNTFPAILRARRWQPIHLTPYANRKYSHRMTALSY